MYVCIFLDQFVLLSSFCSYFLLLEMYSIANNDPTIFSYWSIYNKLIQDCIHAEYLYNDFASYIDGMYYLHICGVIIKKI